jgi:hypothetical protein
VTWISVKSTNGHWIKGPIWSLSKPQGPLMIKIKPYEEKKKLNETLGILSI